MLSHSPTDHIHADLQIELEGELLDIPANIGLSSGAHLNPHTHDASGELHIGEGGPPGLGNTFRFLTLDDFFDVWRQAGGAAGNNPGSMFSATQIMDRTIDSQSEVLLLVNGNRNTQFEQYVPHDGDQIEIQFNRKSWHNSVLATDVNGRDGTTPIDALLIIRELSLREYSSASNGKLDPVPKKFLDVDNDTFLGPLDALQVIGALPSSNGDSSVQPSDVQPVMATIVDLEDSAEQSDRFQVHDSFFATIGRAHADVS